MINWKDVLENVSPKTSQFKVLVFLAFRGPNSPNEISLETGLPPGTVRPALRTLLGKGYVEQQEDTKYKSMVPFTQIISHLYTSN